MYSIMQTDSLVEEATTYTHAYIHTHTHTCHTHTCGYMYNLFSKWDLIAVVCHSIFIQICNLSGYRMNNNEPYEYPPLLPSPYPRTSLLRLPNIDPKKRIANNHIDS